jgi:hypothetical protein
MFPYGKYTYSKRQDNMDNIDNIHIARGTICDNKTYKQTWNYLVAQNMELSENDMYYTISCWELLGSREVSIYVRFCMYMLE